jgi:hypothetical protein
MTRWIRTRAKSSLSLFSFFLCFSLYLTFLQLWEQTFGATVGEKKRRERDPEPDGRVPPPPLDDVLWKKGGLKQQWVSAFRLLLFFFCLFIQFISESLYFVCFNFMFLFKCTCLVFIPACAYAPCVHVNFVLLCVSDESVSQRNFNVLERIKELFITLTLAVSYIPCLLWNHIKNGTNFN